MLEQLHINNFAIIDNVSLDFNNGFTVLTGETGAGKSILIGALSFLLGGKADISQIRAGAQQSSVSAVFALSPKNDEARDWLFQRGIQLDNDKILIRRILRDTGKTSTWIGDCTVTRNELSDFIAFLIDIHGQNEHQSLMKTTCHRLFLDAYAGITDEVATFSKMYDELVDMRKKIAALDISETERSNKIELLTFACKEISESKLRPREEEDLQSEELKLSQFEKLYSHIHEITETLRGEGGIIGGLKRLRTEFDRAASLDSAFEASSQRFESLFYELSDVANDAKAYERDLVFNPERLQEVQNRLSEISKLKKKYNCDSISALLEYAQTAEADLRSLAESSGDKKRLEEEASLLEKKIFLSASQISQKRQAASEKMARGIESVLSELGMAGTKFAVRLQKKEGDASVQKCSRFGFDDVEFLISPNPGSPLNPLSKIASGGEISRVMLAIKTILADNDAIETLIFDEIDTGIGGEVANSLGKHLCNLAKSRQVLCITHLAGIASFADNQIKIEKKSDGASTQTGAFYITGNQRITEIARMLSGDSNSSTSLEHAKDLLEKNRRK